MDTLAILHLFEFDMFDFNGVFTETLRITDCDVFVNVGGVEYTPLAITFDSLHEDASMSTSSVSLSIDNISGGLTTHAFNSEWRGNRCSIQRVLYKPPSEQIEQSDGSVETYDYGYALPTTDYPLLDLDAGIDKDIYILFEGIIDTFSATETAIQANVNSLFIHWKRAYPKRTLNQNEFTSVVAAINADIYWGRPDDV